MRDPSRRTALVAGGGTAGHVMPALSIARALSDLWGDGTVTIVGSSRGMESTLLAGDGNYLRASHSIGLVLLPGKGIVRRMGIHALKANAVALYGLAVAFGKALSLVLRSRPSVVVAVGGYASVAVALAGIVAGVPLVTCNTDAVPGAANRLLGRFARANAVGFPGVALPRAVLTGAPVRPEVEARAVGADLAPSRRAEARSELGMESDVTLVAAFGGSLGAKSINEAVLELAELWAGRDDRAIYHVVGRRDWQWAQQEAARRLLVRARTRDTPDTAQTSDVRDTSSRYVQVEYEERMPLLLASADLAVCRAGAMTVAELSTVGLPAVMVPLPNAPGDHQTANARALAATGGAVLVADRDCSGLRLETEIESLIGSEGGLDARHQELRDLARPRAAEAIAALAAVHARPVKFAPSATVKLRACHGIEPGVEAPNER